MDYDGVEHLSSLIIQFDNNMKSFLILISIWIFTISSMISNVYGVFLMLFPFLEKKRIKFHLMRTEYSLRLQNTDHLNNLQKQSRLRILDLLHKYWKNEEFPINTTHKQKIPQIKDKNGTLCAVAYVLHNSDQQKLVNEIAQKNNYVHIDDVPNNHPLIYSLNENGISKKKLQESNHHMMHVW